MDAPSRDELAGAMRDAFAADGTGSAAAAGAPLTLALVAHRPEDLEAMVGGEPTHVLLLGGGAGGGV